jgi:methyl-accepting chemotaxis protein
VKRFIKEKIIVVQGTSLMHALRISGRLWVGFGALCFVLAAAVGFTIITIGSIVGDSRRVVELRAPAANTSADLTAEVNGSLAILRGWS